VKPVAVDTNVLVRLASGDSPGEHRRVLAALDRQPWRVLTTVLLETEWVLRSRYGYSTAQFARFIEWLDSSDRVELDDASCVRSALRLHREGLDFADALHLAQAGDIPFMTLDRKLLRRSTRLGLSVVPVEPLRR
jgi:predicted nucleic acid-binding protein